MKIIKYGAPWCGQCKVMSKILEESGIPYEEFDVSKDEGVLANKGIKSIPFTEFYNDSGELVHSQHGIIPIDELKEITKKYE